MTPGHPHLSLHDAGTQIPTNGSISLLFLCFGDLNEILQLTMKVNVQKSIFKENNHLYEWY